MPARSLSNTCELQRRNTSSMSKRHRETQVRKVQQIQDPATRQRGDKQQQRDPITTNLPMQRRTFIKISAVAAATAVIKPFHVRAESKKSRFGFSQVTIVEPWRVQFNKDMKKEAEKHPDLELIITDGQDKTEKQVADIENLIRQGVDVLLISPKESAGLTGVTLKAIEAGIPTIILDRNVDTDKYTQFIGGDNVEIGRAAGDTRSNCSAVRATPKVTSSSSGAAWAPSRPTIAAPDSTHLPTRNLASSRCSNRSIPIGSSRKDMK